MVELMQEVMRALLRKGPVCHGIFRRSPNSKERRQLDEYLDQGKPVPDHFHASVYASVLKVGVAVVSWSSSCFIIACYYLSQFFSVDCLDKGERCQ